MLKQQLEIFMNSLKDNNQLNYNLTLESKEATKSVIIEPFFQKLGYKSENFAEFRRQIQIENDNNSKADYGIYFNNILTIVINSRKSSVDLDQQDVNTLKHLFNNSTAQFGILTNGLVYKFYISESAMDRNTMGDQPFFTFDLENFNDNDIQKLENFKRDNFNADKITENLESLNMLHAFESFLQMQIKNPSDELVNLFIRQSGYEMKNANSNIAPQPILKNAMEQVFYKNNNESSSQSLEKELIMNEKQELSQGYQAHFDRLGSNNLKNILTDIRNYIFSLNSFIIEKSPNSYITYYFDNHFLRIFTQDKSIIMYLRLSDTRMIEYSEFGKKLPDGHRHGEVQFSIKIEKSSELDKVKEMIKVAYEYAKN